MTLFSLIKNTLKSRWICASFLSLTPVLTEADIVVTYQQDGADILYSWSGSLDHIALGPADGTTIFTWFAHSPASDEEGGGSLDIRVALYGLTHYDLFEVTGSADKSFTFGTSTTFDQTDNIKTGDDFGFESKSNRSWIFLPTGYAGETINGSLRVTNHSLIDDGIFATTVNLGAIGKIIVTPASIPEPSSALLLGLGTLTLLPLRRRYQAKTQ